MKINNRNLFFYLLLWIFLFLLRSYVGSFYVIIYRFLTTVILLDVIHFIIVINSIYYYQDFSTEHPVKNQSIDYKLTIENRSSLIPSKINIYFTESTKLEKISPKLPIMDYCNISSNFTIQYRGIYRVGIDKIECIDFLNIIHFNKSFWPRTFYVYPQINPDFNFINPGKGLIASKNKAISAQYKTYLDSIDEYNVDSKLSDISWKHFASKGYPYIKKYNSDEISSCNLFLDLSLLPKNRIGKVDDLAIEIFISILHSNLTNQIETYINNETNIIDSIEKFNKVYKESIYIKFNKEQDKVFLSFLNQKYDKNSQLIIITTMENDYFLDIDLLLSYSQLKLILITGNIEENNDKYKNKIKILKKLQNRIDIVWVN